MFKQVKTHALALVPASFLVAGAANAAPVDVSGVVADIGAQAAPIAAIGAAVPNRPAHRTLPVLCAGNSGRFSD